ncbi:uncharacterized protein E0L32_001165 [Thyridium curvatum]|uniref:Uncharacterized protein n=1 Tax=Thyridium curvatum TaxID=1093900 RepID=A0A507AV29_9PEZI|nr:uncharacterized protein E0L32_001165 [Thyridium curvatum]TPX11347.1 hypothetical protein E0L32_001165 [Thyridium curvatum]
MKVFATALLFVSPYMDAIRPANTCTHHLTSSGILAAANEAGYPAACPTITSHSRCSTCMVPQCLALSTMSLPCGCPDPPATTTVHHDCAGPEPCSPGGCGGTQWSVIPAAATCGGAGGPACPTITSTVTPDGCTPTLPGQSFCAEPACAMIESVTLPCSCVGVNDPPVPTTTVTGPCTCRSGCATFTSVQYLPCPASMPAPTTTPSCTGSEKPGAEVAFKIDVDFEACDPGPLQEPGDCQWIPNTEETGAAVGTGDSLQPAARLSGTKFVDRFGHGAFLKGFSSMAVATYAVERSGLPAPTLGCILQKVVITAGMHVTSGFEFALGKRDIPARMTTHGYVPLLRAVSQKYVLFWDERDKRGWLANGVSALLHFLRGSLELDRLSKFSSVLKMKLSDLQEADGTYGPASAIEFLTSQHNMSLPLYAERDGKFYCLQDRVEHLCNVLAKLIDSQEEMGPYQGLSLFRPRGKLEGWDYKDIPSLRDPLHPKVATLHNTGKAWVDFIRGIKAVTIFGRGFGELLQPNTGAAASSSSCCPWSTLPKDRFYIAAHVTDLAEIMEANGDANAQPRKLCQDIFWYSHGQVLEPCPCVSQSHSSTLDVSKKHHDPVQALFSSSFKFFASLSQRRPITLTDNGAVIFGHRRKLRWYYKDIGDPVMGDPVEGSESALPSASDTFSNSMASATTSFSNSQAGMDDTSSVPSESSPVIRTSSSNASVSGVGRIAHNPASEDTESVAAKPARGRSVSFPN